MNVTDRSTSLIIVDDASDDSQSSEEPSSPLCQLQPHYQLPTSPGTVNFNVDIPMSPSTSSNSTAFSQAEHSISLDSATVTETDISAGSFSTLHSQPESPPPAEIQEVQPDLPHDQLPASSATRGFKLVIDNIDKTVKPRHQTLDAQTQSLHHVQVYAVKDRIDYSSFSHVPPPTGQSVYSLLPTTSDYQSLKEKFTILVCRILVECIPFFSQDFKGLVDAHVPHQYSSEMAEKSEVVSYLFFLFIK